MKTLKMMGLGLMLVSMQSWAQQEGGFQRPERPQLDEATKRAIEICKEYEPERPAKPEEGVRPSREEMEAMHAKMETFRSCISSNGGTLPERPHHRKPPREEGETASSERGFVKEPQWQSTKSAKH